MNRLTLSARLSRIQEEIPKLSNTISAMKITDTDAYGKNYEELSLDAALRAEKIACSLRNLIFAANLIEKPVLMEKTAEIQGIEIRHTNDHVEIILPGLMPKRTKRVNTTYLTDPLYYSLQSYTREHTLPHFKEWWNRMSSVVFNNLADYLRHGREIEFSYKGRQYSITNHSGFWYLCDDTDHTLLATLCQFNEKETLVSKIATTMIDDLTIRQIFDMQIYDAEKLCIL